MIDRVEYAISKLSLIPAFGDGIGNHVNKAELGVALRKLELVKAELLAHACEVRRIESIEA